ncbi:dehydration-induced 19 homolog 3-like protein [Tanacetum coccineum]
MDADSWAARLSSSTSKRYQYALQSHRSSSSSSDMFMGFEDIEMDDDVIREEFPCPFCSGYFDVVGLCCHIDDHHHLDSKNGVCPVCAVRVGVDMVAHITLRSTSSAYGPEGDIFGTSDKLSQVINNEEKRSRKVGSASTLSLLRRELREGNLQSLFGGSSYLAQQANVAADPLLSSFILPMGDDLGSTQSSSLAESVSVTKSTNEKASESSEQDASICVRQEGFANPSLISKKFPILVVFILSFKVLFLHMSPSSSCAFLKPQSPPLSIEDKEERSRRSEFVQGMLLSTILNDDL